jgi:predicted molibdopterin-dependent oxidoreductase YjgC
MRPRDRDLVRPQLASTVTITVDEEPVTGTLGQSIAGVILASGRLELRRTAGHGELRGVFCGIGVCFDCLVTVNGLQDVRGCQRRAADGDRVLTHSDARRGDAQGTDGGRDG